MLGIISECFKNKVMLSTGSVQSTVNPNPDNDIPDFIPEACAKLLDLIPKTAIDHFQFIQVQLNPIVSLHIPQSLS